MLPSMVLQKASSIIRRRELVAFELLRPSILRVQGTFRTDRRQESHYAYPITLHPNCDCRGIYPRTWAQPLQDLLTQLANAARHQQLNSLTDSVQATPPVTVGFTNRNAQLDGKDFGKPGEGGLLAKIL